MTKRKQFFWHFRKGHDSPLGVCQKVPKWLSDHEKQDSLVWWNQDWTIWPECQASCLEETWHQSPDLNEIEQLWRDLKIAVQRRSPSNLTELERICREEWEKFPKYMCAKLVASYPRKPEAVIAAKGASTKYWVKCLNSYIHVIFQGFDLYKCANISKNLFLFWHYNV